MCCKKFVSKARGNDPVQSVLHGNFYRMRHQQAYDILEPMISTVEFLASAPAIRDWLKEKGILCPSDRTIRAKRVERSQRARSGELRAFARPAPCYCWLALLAEVGGLVLVFLDHL